MLAPSSNPSTSSDTKGEFTLTIERVKVRVNELSFDHKNQLRNGSFNCKLIGHFFEREIYSGELDYRIKNSYIFKLEDLDNNDALVILEYLKNNPAQPVIILNDTTLRGESSKELIKGKELILKVLEFPNVRLLKTRTYSLGNNDSYRNVQLNNTVKNIFYENKSSYNDYQKSIGRFPRHIVTNSLYIDYMHLSRLTSIFEDYTYIEKIKDFCKENNISVTLVINRTGLNYFIEIGKLLDDKGLGKWNMCRLSDCNWMIMPYYSGSYSEVQNELKEKKIIIDKFLKLREL